MESNDEKSSKKIIIPIFIVSILIIILIVILVFINRKTSILPRAKETNTSSIVSISNSFVFASPIRAKANGDLIRVTVFILDEKGWGVIDKKVSVVTNDQGLIIKEIQVLTDETGKAIIDIGATRTGIFYLNIDVSGLILSQKVKLVFD